MILETNMKITAIFGRFFFAISCPFCGSLKLRLKNSNGPKGYLSV